MERDQNLKSETADRGRNPDLSAPGPSTAPGDLPRACGSEKDLPGAVPLKAPPPQLLSFLFKY